MAVRGKTRQWLVGLAITALAGIPAARAAYPEHPVQMVVPFTAAGPTDFLARVLARSLQQQLGQSVIVVNKPGAGGNLGAQYVAKAPADGYTLLFGNSGALFINVNLYQNAGFDPKTDFTPLAYLGEIPNVLVVNADSPAGNLREFVDYARKHDQLSYASSGSGSTNHLTGEMFNKLNGTRLVHVPYRGTAPALNDLLGGQVSAMYLDVLTAAPHVRSGKLRALGVAARERSQVLPEVPTFREQEVPTLERGVAFGLVAPAGLAVPALASLDRAAQAALRDPLVQQALAGNGVQQPEGLLEQQAFTRFLGEQVDAWKNIIERTGASVQ
ncbi:Bug family tripartite tricarboxylate transporter substrate binding protein [Bordetella trematum]|uniref:Bug family tripartite tricarboxylate transporter substrate binding protein n=1 Tax=Bordetella trematum TaxID=123899 RepID=UPI003989212C